MKEVNEIVWVWVDYREERSDVPKFLKLLGAYVITDNLPVGDYSVSKDVAIERKTINDFISSIIEGRLFDQLERLREVPRPYLVIEGLYSKIYKRKFSENAFWAAIISLTESGIFVVHTNSPEETAKFIFNLGRRAQESEKRGDVAKVLRPNVKKKKKDEYGIAIGVLTSLPHIGDKKAREILRKFGSLKNFFNAKQQDIEALLGEKRGREVYKIINYEFKIFKEKKQPSLFDLNKEED